MNVHLAKQEINIQNLEGMRNELIALQQDVKDMQAESCSHEEQLQTPQAKLAEKHIPYPSCRKLMSPFGNVSCPITSLAYATGSSGQNGVAGSSTNQNASSSQLRQVFSESASGTGPS
ncbi:hypothetical protein F4604DRAFT_1691692 [Suillus subluteus]|nr:hypothetical protein F4604DRAFT_1691692 [Suillus subluteus]